MNVKFAQSIQQSLCFNWPERIEEDNSILNSAVHIWLHGCIQLGAAKMGVVVKT